MNTPQAAITQLTEIVQRRDSLFDGGSAVWPIILVGIRGYFLKSMGNPKTNDRGIYDDAIFILSPTTYRAFNANVDPSIRRKKVAVLEPEQVVHYRKGIHRAGSPGGHMAWRQDSPVVVRRDEFVKPIGFDSPDWGISLGNGLWTDLDWDGGRFWINLHKGGTNTTSSLGCQTIPAHQWADFFTTLTTEQTRHSVSLVPYLLVNDPRIS